MPIFHTQKNGIPPLFNTQAMHRNAYKKWYQATLLTCSNERRLVIETVLSDLTRVS